MEYKTEDLLQLSGIQHFIFCRRQWALQYVEQTWHDNYLTVEGKEQHKNADNPFFTEVRNGVVTSRAIPVASYQLGISGICDVVEFVPVQEGVILPNRQGFYQPYPVEYKHGVEKPDKRDEAQLCAQALCLEEMLSTSIDKGFLFYQKSRQKIEILLTTELRTLVISAIQEMHNYYQRGYTPIVKPKKECRACSLINDCLPSLLKQPSSASQYIQEQIKK